MDIYYLHAVTNKITKPDIALQAWLYLLMFRIDKYRPCNLCLALCRIGRSYIKQSRALKNAHTRTCVQACTCLYFELLFSTSMASADASKSKAWLCWNNTPFTAVLLIKVIAASLLALKNDNVSGGNFSRYPFPCQFSKKISVLHVMLAYWPSFHLNIFTYIAGHFYGGTRCKNWIPAIELEFKLLIFGIEFQGYFAHSIIPKTPSVKISMQNALSFGSHQRKFAHSDWIGGVGNETQNVNRRYKHWWHKCSRLQAIQQLKSQYIFSSRFMREQQNLERSKPGNILVPRLVGHQEIDHDRFKFLKQNKFIALRSQSDFRIQILPTG